MNASDLSYEFYFNVYSGSAAPKLSQDEFPLLREKAWTFIFSHIRGNVPKGVQDDLFMTACEIAESLRAYEKAQGIKSESIDGYSVTYEERRSFEGDLMKIVLRRLGGSGILYAGVDGC